jgi:hypothetical protein
MTDRDRKIIPFPGQPPRGSLDLRVELAMVPYPIWRHLRLPDDASFWALHVAIQDAMGWAHRHRHIFTADHPVSGERLRLGIPEDNGFNGRGAVLPSWQVKVVDVVRRDHPPFLYTYHLGEEWQHEVSLEDVAPPGDADPGPLCLDGAGVCPPEGLGGPEAFGVRFAAGRDALPAGFDPDAFDPAAVVFCEPGQRWHDYFGEDT